MTSFQLINGDCLEVLKTLPDNSVDSIVTDPPYGLSFMGKKWDYDVPTEEVWKECLRVLKPGGHLLSFAGTRTQHRMAVRIEDAGFEIRDMIAWIYGSGFPKSLNIGKAVDKLQGNEKFREKEIEFVKWLKSNLDCYWCSGLGVISDNEEGFGDPSSCLDCGGKGKYTMEDVDEWLGTKAQAFHFFAESDSNRQIPNTETYTILKSRLHLDDRYDDFVKKHSLLLEEIREVQGYEKSIKNWDKKYNKAILNKPKTELASKWEGWGTALKPALEPITVARKPLIGTVGWQSPPRPDKDKGTSKWEGWGTALKPALEPITVARKPLIGTVGWQSPPRPDKDKGTSKWEGWGTALKPALEPITVARKPLIGTVAENVLTHGTGGLNIDGCRVEGEKEGDPARFMSTRGLASNTAYAQDKWTQEKSQPVLVDTSKGRWPANLIHDGSEEVLECFPNSKSSPFPDRKSTGWKNTSDVVYGGGFKEDGSAARFFKACSPTLEYDSMSVCKHTNANNVELALRTIRATIGNTAPLNVEGWLDERLVQNVKSAGIVCQRCATSIAQELAKIRSLVFKNEGSLATPDFIGNFKNSIPILNLASIVAVWESIDTTPTTQNLSQLFGSVLLATDENTSSERKEAVGVSGEPKRLGYFPKASKKDRDEGLEGFEEKEYGKEHYSTARLNDLRMEGEQQRLPNKNNHPTVKPTALMRYLVKLVTPPGGTVLDPFTGSGSTGKACKLEGFDFIGIEREEEYVKIAEARIKAVPDTLL